MIPTLPGSFGTKIIQEILDGEIDLKKVEGLLRPCNGVLI